MKNFGVLTLAVIATLVATSYAENFMWGNPGTGDLVIHQETVDKKSKMLRVIKEDVSFPMMGIVNSRIITAVKVTDLVPNGKGASAALTAGGPGYNHVKMTLKSKRGKPIKSYIQIYAR